MMSTETFLFFFIVLLLAVVLGAVLHAIHQHKECAHTSDEQKIKDEVVRKQKSRAYHAERAKNEAALSNDIDLEKGDTDSKPVDNNPAVSRETVLRRPT